MALEAAPSCQLRRRGPDSSGGVLTTCARHPEAPPLSASPCSLTVFTARPRFRWWLLSLEGSREVTALESREGDSGRSWCLAAR